MVDGSCSEAPIPLPPVAPVSFHADILLFPNKPSPPNKSLFTVFVSLVVVVAPVVAFDVGGAFGADWVNVLVEDDEDDGDDDGDEFGSYLHTHGGHGGAL